MPNPKPKSPEQLYLEGTAPPRDVDLEAKLEAWLDAIDAKKASSEDAKLCHLVLLATLQERGVAAYPYRDRGTGEKRVIKIKAGESKVCTAKAPKPERVDREKDMAGIGSAADRVRDFEAQSGHKVTVAQNGRTVELEVVMDDADPFASTTRSAMTPAQVAVAESEAARAARRNGKAQS